jgi:acetylornithine/succinyldiaminopimelate/putrescine aminotransferase/predicted amino acid dehydrogenase
MNDAQWKRKEAREIAAEFEAETPPPRASGFKPRFHQRLRAVRLDVSYERGAGDYLYYREGDGREIEVLDLAGGFGCLMWGHAHPELVAEAQRMLAAGRPFAVQGSRRELAGRLAEELSRRAGRDYAVLFASTGSEAVEAALKHALIETEGRTVLCLERAFHGKTLTALRLASAGHRLPFQAGTSLKIVRVPANDVERLEAAFARPADLAAMIVEPVQGEGGVHPLTAAYLQKAAGLCRQRGIPLIADECQTGLGRTGSFLASQALGVKPDYVILSKALGGGLAKISALLVQRDRYRTEFDLRHTSTFAEDDFSCAIALKTLALLDDACLRRVQCLGERLQRELKGLAEEFGDVIAEVRGRGLMIGLEFRSREANESFLLRQLSEREDLLPLLAGYLLREHRVRLLPTLSSPFTFRLQPSVLIGDREISHLMAALRDVCQQLRREATRTLFRFLLDPEPAESDPEPKELAEKQWEAFTPAVRRRVLEKTIPRVGWLCHLIDADDLVSLESDLRDWTTFERERLLERFLPQSAPTVMSAVEIRSPAGGRVQLLPILLPFTSRWVKRRMDGPTDPLARAIVQRGVDAAWGLGCELVSLGQYTSIVTWNGLKLDPGGPGITTGNSYAVALTSQAVDRALRERNIDPRRARLVVVGAAGNIGRACAAMLAPRFRGTILLGSERPGARLRLQSLASTLPRTEVRFRIEDTRLGHVVIAATNAVQAPLGPEHFRENAIVCDIAVPGTVRSDTAAQRPDVLLIRGGIVGLPGGEDLGIPGFPLPAGQTYACMAEGILLGMEGARDRAFTGSLTVNHVRRVEEWAVRHGFVLQDYKRTCVFAASFLGETSRHAAA